MLLLVAGVNKVTNSEEIEHVVWGLSRKDLTRPSFMLPTLDKSPVCVRFCPILFEKDNISDNPGTLYDNI